MEYRVGVRAAHTSSKPIRFTMYSVPRRMRTSVPRRSMEMMAASLTA